MSPTELRSSVLDILRTLDGLEPLKRLSWTELNYQRIKTPISRRRWPEKS